MCNADDSLLLPSVAQALGRMTAAIESSLLDWENGLHSKLDGRGPADESASFSSFFGRTKHLVPFMDQRIEESPGDGDDLSLLLVTRKSSLPLLKDLPLDPSTICKMTSSFAKLRTRHPAIGGGETLARVALRLLTSRNGRLLRECPIRDLVRLCEALATARGALGRERVSLFVRRVVQLLNEEYKNKVFKLGAAEMATFVWSLGELGVKFSPGLDDPSSAHRRLHVTTDLPLPTEQQIGDLPPLHWSNLVRPLLRISLSTSSI